MPPLPLTGVFANLPDPRRDTRNNRHELTDILVIATCALIGGAESWDAIAESGRTKADPDRRGRRLQQGGDDPRVAAYAGPRGRPRDDRRASCQLEFLLREGYKGVTNVLGGMSAWKAAGPPVVDG